MGYIGNCQLSRFSGGLLLMSSSFLNIFKDYKIFGKKHGECTVKVSGIVHNNNGNNNDGDENGSDNGVK